MIVPWPCANACAYVDPVFTSQSYDISVSILDTSSPQPDDKLVLLLICSHKVLVKVAYDCSMALC